MPNRVAQSSHPPAVSSLADIAPPAFAPQHLPPLPLRLIGHKTGRALQTSCDRYIDIDIGSQQSLGVDVERVVAERGMGGVALSQNILLFNDQEMVDQRGIKTTIMCSRHDRSRLYRDYEYVGK